MAHQPDHAHRKKSRSFHKDWRTWTAVVLMLAAMAAYVLTMDESIAPEMEPAEAPESVELE